MKEIWKDILGYEGSYQISNLGRVKSLKRTVVFKKKFKKRIKERIMKPQIMAHGYLFFALSKNGKLKSKILHRLLAIAFIPNPKNKQTINHKNGIKNDNRLINLEWCTHLENTAHAKRIGLIK